MLTTQLKKSTFLSNHTLFKSDASTLAARFWSKFRHFGIYFSEAILSSNLRELFYEGVHMKYSVSEICILVQFDDLMK